MMKPKKDNTLDQVGMCIAGIDASTLPALEVPAESGPQLRQSMPLAEAQAVGSAKAKAQSTALATQKKVGHGTLVQLHTMHSWGEYMGDNLYAEDMQTLLGSSIVTEFMCMYFQGDLPGLRIKIMDWLAAQRLPDVESGLTLKVTNGSFPPPGFDLPQNTKSGFIVFEGGTQILCLDRPQSLRQLWGQEWGVKVDGSPITSMWQSQMITWDQTYLNNFGIAFKVHKEGGVQLLAHGVGLILEQKLWPISDQDMRQKYAWWKPALHQALGEARGADARQMAWAQAFAHQQQQQPQQQQQQHQQVAPVIAHASAPVVGCSPKLVPSMQFATPQAVVPTFKLLSQDLKPPPPVGPPPAQQLPNLAHMHVAPSVQAQLANTTSPGQV